MNIGHLDHGKTTLAAALLYAEASTPRMNTWASLGRENEVALAVYALSIWLDPKTWRSHWHTTRQKRPGYLNTGTYLTVHTFFAAARTGPP